ncbi:hypothetical protein MPSEU_000291500 [Mayamaea pseudoterrestris]|nr:hypothetical protein MPSEU_000291500 [Mayamaea pseudoterrestris]
MRSIIFVRSLSRPRGQTTLKTQCCHLTRCFSSTGPPDEKEETAKIDVEHVAAPTSDWIAPNRPLVGDLGQSHLYTSTNEDASIEPESEELELQRIERELERLNQVEHTPFSSTTATQSVDWLATRRSKLTSGINDSSDIDVKKGMFMSSLEIKTSLESLGGRDIVVAQASEPGSAGYMLVTANTNHTLRSMAETLVRHLRNRDLHLMGVVGAEFGVEGANDPNETWLVVDAGNYVVHLQNSKTRKAVNLEALWFGSDTLRRVDAQDEEAVEAYIAENPVPDDYNVYLSRDWDETMKELQKQRWTQPRHRPVVVKPKTKSRTRNNR